MNDRKPLKLDFTDSRVAPEEIQEKAVSLAIGRERLFSGKEDFTGWVTLPLNYDREEIIRIKETAKKIRSQCTDFVIIGIGGSYLGARAAIELLGNRKADVPSDGPRIHYAGCNLSGPYHSELIDELRGKEVCLCVISKSGTTTEPAIAFALLKDLLIKKYGKEAANARITAVTDGRVGVLREEADREAYVNFVVPDDIGGRYSVLTPVGLLPIAVAGIDIDEILAGAEAEAERSKLPGDSSDYAAVRNQLFHRGKHIEVFEYYEPRLQFFAEWLKQLFGESEGKEGKGIFPAALQFSADLHSMGQFLQEGNPILFETVLNVARPEPDLEIPQSAGGLLAGKSLNQINRAAVEGVMAAHRAAEVPMIKIDIPALTAYDFGQMVHFFETACALSGYLLGVDPFDQPGVESYKSEMRKALQK
jgi:glucose-6-phosphate isomerase